MYLAKGHGVHSTDARTYKNNASWGDGEFLMMRTSFDLQDLDYKYFCLTILAKDGYTVYLNGHKLLTYIWFQSVPHYDQLLLSDKIKSLLKKGTNTLAVYCNVVYYEKGEGYIPVGQVDAYIEGVKKEDLATAP